MSEQEKPKINVKFITAAEAEKLMKDHPDAYKRYEEFKRLAEEAQAKVNDGVPYPAVAMSLVSDAELETIVGSIEGLTKVLWEQALKGHEKGLEAYKAFCDDLPEQAPLCFNELKWLVNYTIGSAIRSIQYNFAGEAGKLIHSFLTSREAYLRQQAFLKTLDGDDGEALRKKIQAAVEDHLTDVKTEREPLTRTRRPPIIH
jgi:hypothetical protein